MTTWLRGWWRRGRHERELARELQFHLDRRVEALMAEGRTRDEAQRAARLELGGGVDRLVAQARAERPGARIDQLWYDLRDAVRALRRSPGIAATSIGLIALVIGANTTIFSMVHGLLTKPAPGVNADRLVTIASIIDGRLFGPEDSYLAYLAFVAQARTVQSLVAYQYERFTVSTADASYAAVGMLATPNYFDGLGIRLERGRPFTREEGGREARDLVAIVSHRFWQNHLQADDQILGKTILVNNHVATIVGVAPPRFNGATLAESADIWVPFLSYARVHGFERALLSGSMGQTIVIGRLAPDASLSQARAEFALLSKRLAAAYPDTHRNRLITILPYSLLGTGSLAYSATPVFMAIFSIVALLTVAIVCANVANLMLARAVVRQREMAVRQSLGASRGRILRVLVIEGVIVSAVACAAACLAAWIVAGAVPKLLPPTGQGVTLTPDFTPDWTVVAYATGLAIVATMAFTIAPALQVYRQAVLPWLKAGEQGVVQGRSRLSGGLVVLQLTCAVLLLTNAGLVYRSQTLIGSRDLGFDPRGLLLFTVNTAGRATTPAANLALIDRLRARLAAVPGVVAVAYGAAPGYSPRDPVFRPGQDQPVLADSATVGSGYLRTLGIAPIAGREFGDEDSVSSPARVLITRNLADALWPGRSPLGETLLIGAKRTPAEIVGIVPNAYFGGYRDDPHPNTFLLSRRQAPPGPGYANFFIRHEGNLEAIAPTLTRALHDFDTQVPLVYLRSMQTQLDNLSLPTRVVSTLLMIFALASLAIATIGQYAVMAFNMRRRTRDFGVRIALGASSSQIMTSVIGEGTRLTTVGLAIGFALSLASSMAYRRFLTGITNTDLTTYASVFTLLALASLLACSLPARRASRINPVEALRQE